jgi:hypothetical protein
MFYLHQLDRFRYAPWLVGIIFIGPAGGYRAKTATSGTHIPQDHEGGRSGTPAFSHIRAVSAFANGVEFIVIDQLSYFPEFGACGKFNPEPIGAFSAFRWYYWQFNHINL